MERPTIHDQHLAVVAHQIVCRRETEMPFSSNRISNFLELFFAAAIRMRDQSPHHDPPGRPPSPGRA